MSSKLEHNQIIYVCNTCSKKRIVLFPAGMEIRVDSTGLSEFVDIHTCKDDKLTALILFVDAQYAVRSQVPISSEEATTSSPDNFASIPVPVPRKSGLSKIKITPPENFKASVINELIVKDKLRQLQYSLESKKTIEERDIMIDSQFCFVHIYANVSNRTDLVQAKRWFKEIANSLEQTIHIKDEIFTLLLTYLEEKLKKDSYIREFKELEILLNSPVTVPISTQKSIKDFSDRWVSIESKLTLGDYNEYHKIILACLDNKQITLLEIFSIMKSHMKLSYFLSAVHDLFSNAFIKLEKPQFFGISDFE
ncbi:MAG: hypothetical protein KGD64_11960 [Candidatus Heimdallarchaeota archaeon]|nr:hypothetical protein [Candidatus Heimdallarchaeota archaeon]